MMPTDFKQSVRAACESSAARVEPLSASRGLRNSTFRTPPKKSVVGPSVHYHEQSACPDSVSSWDCEDGSGGNYVSKQLQHAAAAAHGKAMVTEVMLHLPFPDIFSAGRVFPPYLFLPSHVVPPGPLQPSPPLFSPPHEGLPPQPLPLPGPWASPAVDPVLRQHAPTSTWSRDGGQLPYPVVP